MGITFESLRLKCRDRMSQIVEQPYCEVQLEDSQSNVSTTLSSSSASALTQIDLELHREELQIEAKKAQVQMQPQMLAKQTEFELRDGKLRLKQRRQGILARNSFRQGSRISYKSRLSRRNSYSMQARDSIWAPFLDVAGRWTIRLYSLEL